MNGAGTVGARFFPPLRPLHPGALHTSSLGLGQNLLDDLDVEDHRALHGENRGRDQAAIRPVAGFF